MHFTEYQRQILRSVVDRLLPADEYPGGWEAGVGEYLARQFEADLQSHLETYRTGLEAIEAEAIARHQVSFAHLTPTQQDALLQRIEQGHVETAWPIPARPFFRMVVEHTMQGYYSHPMNGGNLDAVAWHMIGFSKGSEGSQ